MPPLPPFTTSQQLTHKARIALDMGRPQEAVSLLLQALSGVTSGNEGAYVMCWLSEAFIQQTDWENALLWADRATAAAPEYEWSHRLRSRVLDKMSRFGEAIEAAQIARDLSPETPWAYQRLAGLYIRPVS